MPIVHSIIVAKIIGCERSELFGMHLRVDVVHLQLLPDNLYAYIYAYYICINLLINVNNLFFSPYICAEIN